MRALCVRARGLCIRLHAGECAHSLVAYKMQLGQHAARRQLVGKVNGFLYVSLSRSMREFIGHVHTACCNLFARLEIFCAYNKSGTRVARARSLACDETLENISNTCVKQFSREATSSRGIIKFHRWQPRNLNARHCAGEIFLNCISQLIAAYWFKGNLSGTFVTRRGYGISLAGRNLPAKKS